jgi:hypothetical protein
MTDHATGPDAYGVAENSIPGIDAGYRESTYNKLSDVAKAHLADLQESLGKDYVPVANSRVFPNTLPVAQGRNPVPQFKGVGGISSAHLTLNMIEEYQPAICEWMNGYVTGLLFHKRFVEPFIEQGLRLIPGDRFRPITLQAIEGTNTNTDYFLFEGSKLRESQHGSGFTVRTHEEWASKYRPGEPIDANKAGTWKAYMTNIAQSHQYFPATCMVENPSAYDIWLPTSFASDVSVFLSKRAYALLTDHKEIQPKYRKRYLLPTYHTLENVPLYPRTERGMTHTVIGHSRPLMPGETIPAEWTIGHTFPREEIPRIAALRSTQK